MPKDSDEVRRRKRREKRREYVAKYPEKARAAQRKRAANPENIARIVEWTRNKRARMTIDERRREYAQAKAARDRRAGRPRSDICDICGTQGSDKNGICFDHCHANGHFRGWLCRRCNIVLGFVEDSPILLMKMAAYLKRTSAPSPQLTLPGI